MKYIPQNIITIPNTEAVGILYLDTGDPLQSGSLGPAARALKSQSPSQVADPLACSPVTCILSSWVVSNIGIIKGPRNNYLIYC